MNTVAIYARSTSVEQTSSTGVEAQVKALKEYAKAHNMKVIKIYKDEGQSGENLLRPQLTKLREDMVKGEFKIVIANSLDRLSRNVNDYWILKDLFKRHGIGIEYVNSPQQNSAAESFTKSMMEACDEYYKHRLGEEVKAGIIKRSEQKAKTPAVKQEVFSETN